MNEPLDFLSKRFLLRGGQFFHLVHSQMNGRKMFCTNALRVSRLRGIAHARRPQSDAKRKGARLLLGGNVVKRKGNCFEPTVFADVDHSMALMKDESFGAIIGNQTFTRPKARHLKSA